MKERIILEMMKFYKGDPCQIQHFLKVYEFAHMIGIGEGLSESEMKILDITTIMHDIGIRPAREKYGKSDGKLQEKEGPAVACEMLAGFLDVTEEEKDRICYLIGHHHTYIGVDGRDYQILLEADYLVNAYEGNADKEEILTFRKNVFKTKKGIELLDIMYALEG